MAPCEAESAAAASENLAQGYSGALGREKAVRPKFAAGKTETRPFPPPAGDTPGDGLSAWDAVQARLAAPAGPA